MKLKSYCIGGNDIVTESDIFEALQYEGVLAGSRAILFDGTHMRGPVSQSIILPGWACYPKQVASPPMSLPIIQLLHKLFIDGKADKSRRISVEKQRNLITLTQRRERGQQTNGDDCNNALD